MNTEMPFVWVDYLVRFQVNSSHFDSSYAIAHSLYSTAYYDNSLAVTAELLRYLEHTICIQAEIKTIFAKIKQIPKAPNQSALYAEVFAEHGLHKYPNLDKYIKRIGKTNTAHMQTILTQKKHIHALRAAIYDGIQSYKLAIAEYYCILDIFPDDNDTKFRLAVTFYKLEDYSLAKLCLDMIEGELTNSYDFKVVRGLIFEHLGDYNEACCLYQQCVDIAPNEVTSLNVMVRYMESASKLPLYADKQKCRKS